MHTQRVDPCSAGLALNPAPGAAHCFPHPPSSFDSKRLAPGRLNPICVSPLLASKGMYGPWENAGRIAVNPEEPPPPGQPPVCPVHWATRVGQDFIA